MYDDIIREKTRIVDDRNLTKTERMRKVIKIWGDKNFRLEVLEDLDEEIEEVESILKCMLFYVENGWME